MKKIKGKGWKLLCIILLIYTILGGLLFDVPRLPILNETIRALHFHVTMWFGMIILLGASMYHSVRYLRSGALKYDMHASALAQSGLLFGILGVVTGMFWAKYTWGEPWSSDPKQNAAAVGIIMYLAYFILRSALEDPQQKARIGAAYNIFAYFCLIPLLFVLPRLTDSLHPGNGGNPGFNAYDLDGNLRVVFYPAIIGWTLLGYWIATISSRIRKLAVPNDH